MIRSVTHAAQCARCGRPTTQAPELTGSCEACGFAIRFARPGLLRAGARAWRESLATREGSLWRYRDLLPVGAAARPVTLGEGWTPLLPALRLGRELGLTRLLIKDERRNPTHSFKDRQAALLMTALAERGVNELVVASTGNVALACAAYAARAGMTVHAFYPAGTPALKIREAEWLGARTIRCALTYDQTKQEADRFARERELFLETGARNLACLAAMETLAFELAEQLGWEAPDWYVQAVSGGMGPIGVDWGFEVLADLGLIDRRPALGIVQAAGCAPMVAAYTRGAPQAAPVARVATAITTLATADPGPAFEVLNARVRAGGGAMVAVSDEAAWEAGRLVARLEGIAMEPAAAAAFAGLVRLAAEGAIAPDATVVVNCTGHTYPAGEML